MNFNMSAMQALLSLPDAGLWEAVREIARAGGITLPATTPSPQEMQKLRSILANGEGMNPEQAKKIINEYKAGKK